MHFSLSQVDLKLIRQLVRQMRQWRGVARARRWLSCGAARPDSPLALVPDPLSRPGCSIPAREGLVRFAPSTPICPRIMTRGNNRVSKEQYTPALAQDELVG